MSNQIRFPRKLNLGLRPWYGLTLRQLVYLGVSVVAGGVVLLAGSFEGAVFIVRIIIGVALIGSGVMVAFFRKDGMSLEAWLVAQVRFFMRPQKRVWNRGQGKSIHDNAEFAETPAPEQPGADLADAVPERVTVRRPRPAPVADLHAAAYVFIDLAVIAVLVAVAVYMVQGNGLNEINMWLSMMHP